jgi:hypothetical protein
MISLQGWLQPLSSTGAVGRWGQGFPDHLVLGELPEFQKEEPQLLLKTLPALSLGNL